MAYLVNFNWFHHIVHQLNSKKGLGMCLIVEVFKNTHPITYWIQKSTGIRNLEIF